MIVEKRQVRRGVDIPYSPAVELPRSEFVPVTEQVSEGDRIFTRSVIKEVDPKERFKGFKVSDFTLENLASVGAVDSLQPISIVGSDGLKVDSVLSRQLDLLDRLTPLKSDENA